MAAASRAQPLPNGTKIMGASKAKKKFHGEIVGWAKQGTFWKYEIKWTHQTKTTWEMPKTVALPEDAKSGAGSMDSDLGASASTSNLHLQFFAGTLVTCHISSFSL